MALGTSESFGTDLSRLLYTQVGKGEHFNLEADTLPNGFPTALETRFVWNGARLADEEQYTYTFTDEGILEVEAGLAFFKALELDGDLVTQETFPLPTLRSILQDLCDEVHNGKGFFVLSGLDADKYSVEDSTIIFLGLQAYIAEQRARQDDNGNMIVHIISDSSTASSPTRDLHSRHSKKSITFHTEETGDIIAWQTRNTAARGGSCIISSTHTIYNILANTRPDIIRILAQPNWPFALPTFHLRPILFYDPSTASATAPAPASTPPHLILNFCRAALLGSAAHPRAPHLPGLTPPQLEALNVLEGVARGVELRIRTRPGDVHFVNNLTLLHRRDAFEDADEEGIEHEQEQEQEQGSQGNVLGGGSKKKKKKLLQKRHLVRMRLRNEVMGWRLPGVLAGEWEKVFADEGGGARVAFGADA